MKVLILSALPVSAPTGVSTYIKTLEKNLQGRHQVKVLSFLDSQRHVSIFFGLLSHLAKRLVPSYLPDIYTKRYLHQLISALRKDGGSYDIIHVQDIISARAVYEVYGAQQKMICTCHYNDDPAAEHIKRYGLSGKRAALYKRFIKDCFSVCKYYIGVSSYVLKKSDWLFPKDAHITIIPNGVNFDTIANEISNTPITQAEKLTISNVGFLEERKNQMLLLDIARCLIDEYSFSDFEIRIIGEGEQYELLQAFITKMGLSEQVKMLGKKQDPWREVASGNMYLHVAKNDNSPYAVIEAFAAQVAVFAIGNGGIPELFFGAEGVIPTTATAADIAKIIYNNRNQLSTIQSRQNDVVKKHLNLPQQIQQLETRYHHITES